VVSYDVIQESNNIKLFSQTYTTFFKKKHLFRWFINDGWNRFDDPGVPDLNYTPFGWGTCSFDVNNNGLTDIVFHGGGFYSVMTFLADNSGPILVNQGDGTFFYDKGASSETDHRIRLVLFGVVLFGVVCVVLCCLVSFVLFCVVCIVWFASMFCLFVCLYPCLCGCGCGV